MKNPTSTSWFAIPSALKIAGNIAAVCTTLCTLSPAIASDLSISGESNTILRMRTTIDKKNIYPMYEYLRLNMTDNRSDGSAVSFFLGAWGRGDLGEHSGASGTDGDLQYAYLTYRAPKNNTAVTVGRQFVSEGIAAERIDGVFLRSDFKYGLAASAFFGNSVITEPNPQVIYRGGAVVYGARISQANKKYYDVGLSVLKSEREDNSRYREEEGLDLWLHPFQQMDVTGRSAYNSITNGWMEHSYALSYSPLSTLRLGLEYANVNFKDYLFNMTTPALSISNPLWSIKEKQTVVGTGAAYTGIKDLNVSVDYKFYSYDQSGDANYVGGKASYSFPEALSVGCGLHRMEGYVDKLRYTEVRAFVAKKLGHADLALDVININYDKAINNIRNSYSITGAAGYEVSHKLKLGADFEYSRNPDFDNEVRTLVKATYAFDSKSAAEGGSKSEK